jgi:superfamily II DNA or RNA helicase
MDDGAGIFSQYTLSFGPWQAFERSVARFLIHDGYDNVRLIGGSGDGGGDVIAHKYGKRFVFQVKFRSSGTLSEEVALEVENALRVYKADIPVIVTNVGFSSSLLARAQVLSQRGINLQLWDKSKILELQSNLNADPKLTFSLRDYQLRAIDELRSSFEASRSGLVVMATGLGKTLTAMSGVRKLIDEGSVRRVLILAHTNELVYQLERSSWGLLKKHESTAIWNGYESGDIKNATLVFACINSVYASLPNDDLGDFDMVVIDEAHHAGSPTYQATIEASDTGATSGSYLLGLTATPWRSDEVKVRDIFKDLLVQVDMVEGLSKGYLSNVDYRMHIDDLDWDKLAHATDMSPKQLNKKIFIDEWNDAIIHRLQEAFAEVPNPRAIIFCSTIEHAHIMKGKILARNFSTAEVIYSGSFNGRTLTSQKRSLLLSDFHDGLIGVMCVVDIFNEGVDVPDVNIIVFQRVTHSRTIFIQQLGRGLRIKEGKDKVIVLDFVSDIRRIAAGLELQAGLSATPRYVKLGKPVKFIRDNSEDVDSENFFKEWMHDVAAIEAAGDNDHILRFPPNHEV